MTNSEDHIEAILDLALEATFPASDAVALAGIALLGASCAAIQDPAAAATRANHPDGRDGHRVRIANGT
jgi:hypothetical protein